MLAQIAQQATQVLSDWSGEGVTAIVGAAVAAIVKRADDRSRRDHALVRNDLRHLARAQGVLLPSEQPVALHEPAP